MDEQGTTALMAETLQEGLSRARGRPVRVRRLERAFFSRSSSFWAERLRVQLDGDERLEVFFKDLNPRHLINGAAGVRTGGLGPSQRELLMYQQVLSPEHFDTPQLYAARWDPEEGNFWLFLEDAGGAQLRQAFLHEVPERLGQRPDPVLFSQRQAGGGAGYRTERLPAQWRGPVPLLDTRGGGRGVSPHQCRVRAALPGCPGDR